MTAARPALSFATFVWLCLATITLHALTPSATPWRPGSGSAFNGFTRDVSLAPRRAALPEQDRKNRAELDGSAGDLRIIASAPHRLVRGARTLVAPPDPQRRRARHLSLPTQHAGGAWQARAPPLA